MHKSDPWENSDCLRENCKTCETSHKMDKPKFKNCKRRSIVYRVWCESCKREVEMKSKKEENEKKRNRAEMENNESKIFSYIGETSRSSMERGEEHLKDLQYRRSKSHMLKHIVIHHSDSEPEKIKFGMEILRTHRSSFERQIREAVLIDKYDGPFSMNSKLEYSRTIIPRIKMKMGNKVEKEDPRVTEEKNVVERIKELRTIFQKRRIDGACRENGENPDIGRPKSKYRKIEPEINEEVAKSPEKFYEKKPCENSLDVIDENISKMSDKIPKMSDITQLTEESYSNVKSTSKLSDISNVAQKYCSNVTKTSQPSDISIVAQ